MDRCALPISPITPRGGGIKVDLFSRQDRIWPLYQAELNFILRPEKKHGNAYAMTH